MFWRPNKQRTRDVIHTVVSTLVMFLFILMAGLSAVTMYQWINDMQRSVADLERQQERQETLLEETRNTIDVLAQQNTQLRQSLSRAREGQQEARQAIQQTQQQFSTRINRLQSNIQNKVAEAAVSDLVETWKHRVARVRCQFSQEEGDDGISHGSAVALSRGSGVEFVTNRHIVEQDEFTLVGCKVRLPESDETYTVRPTNIQMSDDIDVAYIDIPSEPSMAVQRAARSRRCTQRPSIGQRVVILGYPSVGAESGITATEGIISGHGDPYYVTSAKIEQGNSGGAAVLLDDGCFLGMPTLSVAGKLESLARILPAPEL